MQGKQLHDFLFNLYDFADTLAGKIESGESGFDTNSYFLTLVYIEQIFDTYGRGLISRSAQEANDPSLESNTSLAEAHRRIDLLRTRIQELVNKHDFNETIDRAGEKLTREWRKRDE